VCSAALLWLCYAAADRCEDVEAEANLGATFALQILLLNFLPASTSPDVSAVASLY